MRTIVYKGITLKLAAISTVEIVDGQLTITDEDLKDFEVELVQPTNSSKKKIKDPIDVSIPGTCARIIRQTFKKSGDTFFLIAESKNPIRSAFNSRKLGCKCTVFQELKNGKTVYEVTQK